jgi:hypothetical protein
MDLMKEIMRFAARAWVPAKKYPTKQAWLQGEFKWTLPIKWMGIDGFAHLDADRRVKISLNYGTYADHWDRVIVTILSKHDGKIDAKSFKFNDYMNAISRPNDTDKQLWCYDQNGGASWYIAIPDSTAPFVQAVEEYIHMFE